MVKEIWDGYNEKGELLGIDLIRGNSSPEGVYNLIASVLVKHADGDYLLMQRDLSKTWSGFFEATAGGAVLKGETPEQGAIREVKEETGMEISAPILYKKTVNKDRKFIVHNYIAKTTSDKKSVTLQLGETMAYKWVNEQELIEFIKSQDCMPSQAKAISDYLKNVNPKRRVHHEEITNRSRLSK